MKIAVTGAAGFIGSNLCDALLKNNCDVLGVDNFSTGQREFLKSAQTSARFKLAEIDLMNAGQVENAFRDFKPEIVIHLAANADVRFGLNHPRKDLEQGTICTFNALEAARLSGAKKFAYSSTGSVYGEPEVFPTPETCPFPVQTSLYAASKLAGEGLVQAYAEGFGIKGYIFRFVSILGPRYTHGHVFDFARKLLDDPTTIHVLGNGQQRKAYLHVNDCVSAIWHILTTQENKVNIFNLGPDEYINVNQSLDVICDYMKVSPKRTYAGGERGWIGDSPFIFLDNQKLRSTGWKAQNTIRDSVRHTLDYLLSNRWVLEARATGDS